MERLGENCWTVTQSLSLAGADLGTRMVVVRTGGALMLHSPVRIDDALAAELERLGEVRWLVAPCAFHHLYLRRASERWPRAEVLVVPGVSRKQPKLRIDGVLPEDRPTAWDGSLEVRMIGGMPRLNEVALLHRPSKTLLLADFLFNITEQQSVWGRTVLKLAGAYGGPVQSKLFRLLMKDREAVRATREAILEWDFDRITVCHREVVDRRAKDTFARVTAWI